MHPTLSDSDSDTGPLRVAFALATLLVCLTAAQAGGESLAEAAAVLPSSVDAFECPVGAELRADEAPDGSRTALWCELVRGAEVARHGPYLELYADGSVARQGVWVHGKQVGPWITWSRDGRIEAQRMLWQGEAGRHVPSPEDLCPPGTRRDRSRGYSGGEEEMWSRCLVEGTDEPVLKGPYVTWIVERDERGVRHLLRSITEYSDGKRHGAHRMFDGPSGDEVVVEEETFVDGRLDGESVAYYLDGTLRETRLYDHGDFAGERVGYAVDGTERWRVIYQNGGYVATEGELSVAGVPCPGYTVPMSTPDGLSEFCGRRDVYFVIRDGPFVTRDANGRVEESGLYDDDEKEELWQAPPGIELPARVPHDVLVAEIQLWLGDRPFQSLAAVLPPQRQIPLGAHDSSPPDSSPTLKEHTINEADHEAVKIWFRDLETDKMRDEGFPQLRDGLLKAHGLSPGRYSVHVRIDAQPSNEMQYPGDLVGHTEFEVQLDDVVRVDVHLLYTLHLTEPWDNDGDIPGWRDPCRQDDAILRGPVRFAWRPPGREDPAGIGYHYRLVRKSCHSYADLEVVAEGTTDQTSLVVDLAPSAHDEIYDWQLTAERGDQPLAQLMTFGKNGHGWSLRFRIR